MVTVIAHCVNLEQLLKDRLYHKSSDCTGQSWALAWCFSHHFV